MSSDGPGDHDNRQQGRQGELPRAAPLRRSGPSRIRSFVRFINYTERRVDVIWLNHEGLGVRYRTLAPRQAVDVNTFVGHPWIFRDSETGDRLCVQLREVYEPIAPSSDPDSPRRRQVFITNQLYSLRDRCIQEVRRLVPMSRIHQLELPREISQDLRVHCPDLPVVSLYDQAARSIVAEADQAAPDPVAGLNLTSNPIAAASSDADNLSAASVSSSSGRLHNSTTRLSCTIPGSSQVTPSSVSSSSSSPRGSNQPHFVVRDSRFLLAMASNNNNNNELAVDRNCNNNNSANVANQNVNPRVPATSSSSQTSSGAARTVTSSAGGSSADQQPSSSGSSAIAACQSSRYDASAQPGPSTSGTFSSRPFFADQDGCCASSSTVEASVQPSTSGNTVCSQFSAVTSASDILPVTSTGSTDCEYMADQSHQQLCQAAANVTACGSNNADSSRSSRFCPAVSSEVSSCDYNGKDVDTTSDISAGCSHSQDTAMTNSDTNNSDCQNSDSKQLPSSSSDVVYTHTIRSPSHSGVDSTNNGVSNGDFLSNGEASFMAEMQSEQETTVNRQSSNSDAGSSQGSRDDKFVLPLKKRRQ